MTHRTTIPALAAAAVTATAAAALLAAAGPAAAQSKTIYIGMNGGAMEKAYTQYVFPAFEKLHGAKVVVVPGTSSDILAKAQANKVAQMAHDGFARSINPVHTMGDGDTIFALATGASGLGGNITLIGALAADVMATAVLRAVRAASTLNTPGLPHLPAARDL